MTSPQPSYSATPSINYKKQRLPFLLKQIFVFTILACFADWTILGFNMSGVAWVGPLCISLLVLARPAHAITFPLIIWLPWAMLLIIQYVAVDTYLLDPRVAPFQRTIQLLSPLIVGIAVSTLRPSSAQVAIFVVWLRRLCPIFFLLVLYRLAHFLVTGFGSYSGMAAQMITVVLLASFLANRYLLYSDKSDLFLWCSMLTLPILNVTRTATLAVLLTFPFACAPFPFARRIVVLAMIGLVALGIFYSPRVQQKMFFSGSGDISDIFSDDFATSGRSYMWEQMTWHARNNLWLGHGTGAGETFTYKITGSTGYPHNDWLLTYFDQGLIGVIILVFCLLATTWHALCRSFRCKNADIRLLFFTGVSAFLPFVILMGTDNILVYASFFGNLHFSILGLGYGALRVESSLGNAYELEV